MDDDKISLEVILGTYEEYLLGYKCFPQNDDVKQSFATHSHSRSIRSVCASGKYLASGGADDRIFIYDLQHRKELTQLTYHNAVVNCLAFTPDASHLISGSSDGVLAIVRVGNWQLEKIWEKPHKGSAILDVAVHCSGKLALTLGADHSLCTWNLVKGRQAYIIKLNNKSKDPKNLDRIYWAPDGVRFSLSGGRYTEIWCIKKGGVLNIFEHSSKVICCVWISDDVILVGYENGKIAITNIPTGEIIVHDAHSSRVKCMLLYKDYIVTASSQGDFKIWNEDFKMMLEHNTGCRIICVTAADMVIEANDDQPQFRDEEEVVILSKAPIRKGRVTEEHESDNESAVPIKKSKKKRKLKN
ncbi:hypothetical protein FQA39_LY01725 [Lamprigera yunnana]|nr:hypothetical protein FQA39_LY01725 [Lamprigera yunnana]